MHLIPEEIFFMHVIVKHPSVYSSLEFQKKFGEGPLIRTFWGEIKERGKRKKGEGNGKGKRQGRKWKGKVAETLPQAKIYHYTTAFCRQYWSSLV